jgi:chromosome segregation ATPase
VHIKRVELSHFKSFGGTAQVPLLPGFTVISGPNGSGKSNILDALLFGLGLASSKGMRADRLPDLVNQNQMSRRSTSEASVTVTFDLSDVPPRVMVEADDELCLSPQAAFKAAKRPVPPHRTAIPATMATSKIQAAPGPARMECTRRCG